MVTDRQADRRRHNPSSHSTASVDTLEATIRQYLEGSSVETHHTSLEKKKHGGILGELENLESNFEHLAFGDRRTAITRKTAPKPDAQWSTFRRACYKVTESGIYNVGMVFIILLNVVHLVQETDLRSQKVDSPPFMVIISRTFLVIYLVDLLLRAFVLRRAFFKSGMNVFDAMVVVVDTVLTILPGPLSGLPSMSVLRGLRMLRIVRVIRNLVAFRELYLMMQGLVSAVRAIIFGAGLIVAVLILWSVLAVELVQEENLRLFEEGAYGDCTRCEHAFETVGASMLTFTSTIVAGDSWGRLALPLIESRPWTMLIILPALLSLELGLLNVVAAVIVDRQTQARQDDEKFLHQMRDEELKKSYSRLKCLFASMDDDGSGSLTLEELIESYKFHAEFKELMELMDIGEDDLHLVFSILDKDRSGDVSYNEFVEQLNTMRSTNSHTLLVFIKHLAHRLSEQVDFQSASIEHLSCSLGLEPLKKDNGQGAVGIDADQWYEEVSQEVSEKPRGSKAPAAAEADPKPQSSAWFVRAGPSSLCGGSAASAAAADLNKRFLALSQHVQSSLAAITEDAVRQAGDGVLWESTLALATLQASMPLLHRPAGHRQAPARGPWEELAAGPRRLSVRNSRPGPAGATCPRVRPLKLQARGGPAAAGGSAQDRSSSGPIPLELPVGPRKATRGGRSLPRDTGNLRR